MDPIIRHNTARLTGGWLLVVCHFPIFPTLHKRTFLRIINNFIKHIRYKAPLVRARRYSDGDRWWRCSSVCSYLHSVKRFDKLTQNSETFLPSSIEIICILLYNCTFLHLGVKRLPNVVYCIAQHKAWQVTKQAEVKHILIIFTRGKY